jgi:hypothetical protein
MALVGHRQAIGKLIAEQTRFAHIITESNTSMHLCTTENICRV